MRWLSAAGKKTLDGRRPGRGIYPVAVDEAVGKVDDGADEARGGDERILVQCRG